ncbi:MAG: serine/threonine protein kinase [Polyangiales bacterium]|jgi:serine/threonine protein kinase
MDSLPLECPECGERFSRESSFCPQDGQSLLETGASTPPFDADKPDPSTSGSPSFDDNTAEDDFDEGISAERAPQVPLVLPPPPARPAPQKDPLLGALVGSYRVDGILGQGGMGRIYRAVHTEIGKLVAIKVLRTEVAGDNEANMRFIREARSTSAIGHPNIVDVLDFGALPDGRSYFVMELLEGGSLYQVIQQLGPLKPRRALRMVERLASALQAAHTRGIIHRDLKPGNVFVCGNINRSSEVKLLDFGIAKIADATVRLTVVGSIFGTPQYMAPEQCIGADVDHRADIYALGIMLFEMLTGRPPFDDPVPVEVLIQQRSSPVPSLPQELAALEPLLQRVLAKDPADRYQSMTEFGVALEDASDALSAPPQSSGASPALSPAPAPEHPVSHYPAAQPSHPGAVDNVPAPLGPPNSAAAAPAQSVPGMARTLAFNYNDPPPGVAAPAPYSSEPSAPAPQAQSPGLAAPPPATAPRSTSRGRIALLVLGALSVVVFGAFLVITFASSIEEIAPHAMPLAPAALITVTTQPAGAQLYSGETLLGNTPCPISRPTVDQAFRISLPGYVDAAFTLGPASPDVHPVVLAPSP